MTTTLVRSKQAGGQQDFAYKSFDDLPLYDERYLPRWAVSDEAITASRVRKKFSRHKQGT